MIYKSPPQNFCSVMEVVSCLCESNGEILLLLRHDKKPYGNTWCLPGGKIDKGEARLDAIVREVKEETGLILNKEKITCLNTLYVRYPEYDFVYHIHKTILNNKPEVNIKHDEHKDKQWLFPTNALKLDLIPDEGECIRLVYGIN